jgi:flagellar biosynthesis/type III secretory pathway M-ring protein FliF/YscJ
VDPVAFVAVLVLLALVVALVALPLRAGTAEAADERERRDIEALEEAKNAKYREIRELELDFRTGKLTPEDFRDQDRARRAEAVELLRRLDALGAGAPPAAVPRGPRDGG